MLCEVGAGRHHQKNASSFWTGVDDRAVADASAIATTAAWPRSLTRRPPDTVGLRQL